ncbi:MAG TPA: hypothetical protein DCG75_09995 [Bacteroidales bacterium]|nr:hypothetical protein [Bacteroidales bacterium]
MKKVFFIVIILSFFGCKEENKQTQVLTDTEWRDVLYRTLPFTGGSKPYIFDEFGNVESKDIVSHVYFNCTYLGYEINDSILSYINKRKNNLIVNKLDTMFNVSYVHSINEIDYNYTVYSEPFYVNNQIICVSISNKKVLKDETHEWVFFLKKQKGSFEIIEFYDAQKDAFYKNVPL